MKVFLHLLQLTILVSACTSKPPTRPSQASSTKKGAEQRPGSGGGGSVEDDLGSEGKGEDESETGSGSGGESEGVDPSLELIDVPSDATDALKLTLNWTAESSVSAIAYGQSSACKSPENLPRVEKGKPLTLEFTDEKAETYELCIVAQEGKKWLTGHIKKISIPRKVFSREFKTTVNVKLPGCAKESAIAGTFIIEKTKGTLKGEIDPASTPCWKGASKEFVMNFHQVTWMNSEVKAVWRRGLIDAGWANITFDSEALKNYSGEFGYGDPSEKKAVGRMKSENAGGGSDVPR